jgi:hypothetical protein
MLANSEVISNLPFLLKFCPQSLNCRLDLRGNTIRKQKSPITNQFYKYLIRFQFYNPNLETQFHNKAQIIQNSNKKCSDLKEIWKSKQKQATWINFRWDLKENAVPGNSLFVLLLTVLLCFISNQVQRWHDSFEITAN